MANQNRQPKDKWDKADVIIKGIAAILVTGAITFYGIWSERQRSNIAEDNRRAQIVVQTLSNRESATADLKAKMFATLISHYLKEEEGKHDPDKQLALLELIGLNFQDNLHFKPLFEMIKIKNKNSDEICDRLRKISKNIAKKEIAKIVGSGGRECKVELKLEEDSKNEKSEDSKNENVVRSQCEVPFDVFLRDVKEDHINVAIDKKDMEGFTVNYFDMPLIDNSTKGDATFSIILLETDEENKKATVKLVILPPAYYSTRNSLKTDQVISDFADKTYSE